MRPAFADSCEARGHQAPELGLKTGSKAHFGAFDRERAGRWAKLVVTEALD